MGIFSMKMPTDVRDSTLYQSEKCYSGTAKSGAGGEQRDLLSQVSKSRRGAPDRIGGVRHEERNYGFDGIDYAADWNGGAGLCAD